MTDGPEAEIRVSYDGEEWILHNGERMARLTRDHEVSDYVATAAILSGLGPEEIEAWMEHPGQDAERWAVQPKHVVAAVQGLRTSLEKATPPAAPDLDEGISTQASRLEAALVGERVNFNTQIVSEKGQKALPWVLNVRCTRCAQDIDLDLADPDQSSLLEAIIFKDKATLHRRAEAAFIERVGRGCEKKRDHKIAVEEEDHMDYAVLGVRDLLEEMEKFDQQTYRPSRAHLIGVRPPPSKKVHILGRVVVDPSTRDICVLADAAEQLESQVAGFEVTDEDCAEWPRWFNGELDISTQVAPDMIGRKNVQQAYLLTLHSAPVIPDIHGRHIRGCVRCLCVGDTKTYKSESAKDLTRGYYNLGGYVMGEASSRTGITYTIDTEERAIIWGELPLNDLGLVVIDGLHALFAAEMKELREALEMQRIIVRRMVSGEALARTRVIAILNPEKPMNQYLYLCMAVNDSSAFYDPPDITRWDLFLAFGRGDVPEEDIARRRPAPRPIPDVAFKRHVYWAWSRRPEQIQYTEEAEVRIVEASIDLMKAYALDALPIVHLGVRDVLCRLSVATAALHHSTDEAHDLVIVDLDHVEAALRFYEDMLDRLQLGEYKMEMEGRLVIRPSELTEIVGDLGETELDILNSIKIHAKSSATLAVELDLSEKTIKRHYVPLRRHHLVITKPGVGIAISARGVHFLRALSPKLRDTGTEGVPISEAQQKLGTESVPMSLSRREGGSKNAFSGAGEEGRAAIHVFLNSEGGETTILRLQAYLEHRGFNLEGLNDELARLVYQEKIVRTLNTISLGPEWRRPPSEEAPPVTDGAGGSPGAEEASVEARSEEDVGAVTGEPSPPEPFEAVIGIWTGLERDVEGAALLEGLAELLMRSGFPDPYDLVAEALPAGHLAREGWRVELVGAELRSLGDEGECAVCQRQGSLYADVEGVWPVCLRCRLGQPATASGRPWRFRVVTR